MLTSFTLLVQQLVVSSDIDFGRKLRALLTQFSLLLTLLVKR